MRRLVPLLLAPVLLTAGPVLAQGSASIGRSSGVVHGESWNAGQQDLSGYGTGSNGRPMTRTQALRQRSAASQGQVSSSQAPRRAAQSRSRATAARSGN